MGPGIASVSWSIPGSPGIVREVGPGVIEKYYFCWVVVPLLGDEILFLLCLILFLVRLAFPVRLILLGSFGSTLVGALVKLNIKIQIEHLLKVIHDEGEAKRVAEATHRHAVMSKRQPTTDSLPRPLITGLSNTSNRSRPTQTNWLP